MVRKMKTLQLHRLKFKAIGCDARPKCVPKMSIVAPAVFWRAGNSKGSRASNRRFSDFRLWPKVSYHGTNLLIREDVAHFCFAAENNACCLSPPMARQYNVDNAFAIDIGARVFSVKAIAHVACG